MVNVSVQSQPLEKELRNILIPFHVLCLFVGKRKSIAIVVAFISVISTVLILFIIRLIYRKRKK